MTTETGYPLQWPPGRSWIKPEHREHSPFRVSPGAARDGMLKEIARLGGTDVVVSTNVPLRRDGLHYAGGYRLDDEAVAVYFTYYGKRMCFACCLWWRMHENMHAIAKTIEAIRGIERWGSGDMLATAMSGFTALPAPIVAGMSKPWREVFGWPPSDTPTKESINRAYRTLASLRHPDLGGSNEKMAELNAARDEALKEIGA